MVVLTWALAIGLTAPALADRAFTPRFSTNANGDIAIVGNTLETCQTSAADCSNARAGLGSVLNNNNFSMVRVNTDSATLDSSSARLSLPAGARVLFAGLYYGSRTTAGTGGSKAPDSTVAGLSKVDFKPPGASGFDHLTAVPGRGSTRSRTCSQRPARTATPAGRSSSPTRPPASRLGI
jgi:hypothetical protein